MFSVQSTSKEELKEGAGHLTLLYLNVLPSMKQPFFSLLSFAGLLKV